MATSSTRRTRSAPAITAGTDANPSFIQRAKAYDDARDSFPGEHWLVLGAGLAAWVLTRTSPSPVVRTLGMVAGTALVGRAASGRDGLSKLLRWTPVGKRIR